MAVELIQEAVKNGAPQKGACEVLGISERTYQRWIIAGEIKKDGRKGAIRSEPHNKLTPEEEEAILTIIKQPEYVDLPPSQIVPKLMDQGIYIASESSYYRVMRKQKLQNHRGRSKPPKKHQLTTHIATKPNQVWMWDITYLGSPIKGKYYYLYMIIDLFSRKVVGWEVWDCEKDVHAATLFERTTYKEKIKPGKLVLHSDNGPTMKAYTFRAKLEALGITTSYSRPRVSNDNPYAEAAFRTMKYCPQYPVHGFESIERARAWVTEFVQWYNFEHLHSGINFVTPNQAHTGEYRAVLEKRRTVLETALASNPTRWSKKKIRNLEPHLEVALNPTREKAYEQLS